MSDLWKKATDSWQDSVNLLIGVWLFFSAWILGFAGIPFALWNALIFGVVIAVAAYMAITRFQQWEEWVDMAIGVWLVVSPWLLGFATFTATEMAGAHLATWNFVLTGVVTFLLSAWSLRSHGGTRAA